MKEVNVFWFFIAFFYKSLIIREKKIMNHKEIRAEITQNWLIALDYLLDTGRVRNYRHFEELTGIRNQRISGLKLAVKDESVNNYITVDNLRVLNEKFNISLEFLLYGTKPIIPEKESLIASDNPIPEYGLHAKVGLLESEINLLKDRIRLIERTQELNERESKLINAK